MSPPALFSLDGKVAVVTGGAGQLGLAMGRALADAGAKAVLADLPATLARLPKEAGSLLRAPLDVTKPRSVENAVARISRETGPIDIWINNAGIAVFTPFARRTPQELERVLDVNVKGLVYCTQAVSRRMRARRRGAFVNIGSIYGLVSPDPRIYADSGRNSSEIYGASKAGVIQMTRYFAVHLAPDGIRTNCITPGGVFNRQSPAFVKGYRARTPLDRMASPEDIAAAAVYLASDAAAYVNGHNLVVDGGWTAW
ncbi:MAG TPA: SDR family oxidoreductase [Elusimicrobiota bacterium]|nr:SDR family oxidoreductase [Elusimicrobiota bacterium]